MQTPSPSGKQGRKMPGQDAKSSGVPEFALFMSTIITWLQVDNTQTGPSLSSFQPKRDGVHSHAQRSAFGSKGPRCEGTCALWLPWLDHRHTQHQYSKSSVAPTMRGSKKAASKQVRLTESTSTELRNRFNRIPSFGWVETAIATLHGWVCQQALHRR